MTVGTNSCSSANGAGLVLGPNSNLSCQVFRLDRANDGTLAFASVNGDRVVEVPSTTSTSGASLALFDYTGGPGQRWTTNLTGPLATAANHLLAGASTYPVPAVRGAFTLDLSGRQSAEAVTVEVLDLQGRSVYRRVVAHPQATVAVDAALAPGLSLVRVQQGQAC